MKNNAKTLVFPDEREVDRREKVSFDAMELINSLLQEKEHRLSSKKYRLNDYRHSKRNPGQPGSKIADPHAQDYQGNYVYPDDATDIKAHPFFRRISWDRLHLTRPPFVPDVSGGDDTKYFDEEEPISDVDDAASLSYTPEVSNDEWLHAHTDTAHVTQVDGAQSPDEIYLESAAGGQAIARNGVDKAEATRLRERKRPRDRALRDRDVGRIVLELRKKGAFLGYTYRRPYIPRIDEEPERQRTAKRNRIPSFG